MTMTFLRFILVAAGLVFGIGSSLAAPEIGKPAPTFTAVDSNGKKVSLGDFRGKIVVLEWTNDGCPYVQKHYSTRNMQSLQKEAAQKGIVWLTIISSAPGEQGHVTGAQANELTKARDAAPAAVLLDPEGTIGRMYGAQTTPHMYIIDASGRLVYAGGIDDKPTVNPSDIKKAKNYVRAAFEQLQSGQPVQPSQSRPYGCSIKYVTQ